MGYVSWVTTGNWAITDYPLNDGCWTPVGKPALNTDGRTMFDAISPAKNNCGVSGWQRLASPGYSCDSNTCSITAVGKTEFQQDPGQFNVPFLTISGIHGHLKQQNSQVRAPVTFRKKLVHVQGGKPHLRWVECPCKLQISAGLQAGATGLTRRAPEDPCGLTMPASCQEFSS